MFSSLWPRKSDSYPALSATILLIDDDEQLRCVWVDYLKHKNYHVVAVPSAERGLDAAVRSKPDLILLDWMLPDAEGPELCSELRKKNVQCPIVMVTFRDAAKDVVSGLEYGADDYWIKPVSLEEVHARVAAILRRNRQRKCEKRFYSVGCLEVDLDAQRVRRAGIDVSLNNKEFGILRRLIQEEGGILTREQLLASVWKYDTVFETRTVDNYVVSLRKKIEENPKDPQIIRTVRGQGYRLAGGNS